MKKDIKLYNTVLLVTLFFVPWALISSVVLILLYIGTAFYIASYYIKAGEDRKMFFSSNLPKVLAFGFLADIIGIGVEFLLNWFILSLNLKIPNTGDNLFMTVPAVIISAILIYVFDRFIVFRTLEKSDGRKIARILVITTSPYLLLLPTGWLING